MRKRKTAIILSILLGTFGIQHLYLGGKYAKPLAGLSIIFLALLIIPMAIGLLEGIWLFMMSDEEFDERFNSIVLGEKQQARHFINGENLTLLVYDDTLVMIKNSIIEFIKAGYNGQRSARLRSMPIINLKDVRLTPATPLVDGRLQFIEAGNAAGSGLEGDFIEARRAKEFLTVEFGEPYNDVAGQVKEHIKQSIS